jgi:hypothetical protein
MSPSDVYQVTIPSSSTTSVGSPFALAVPEDVFIHAFEFLTPSDLVQVALVSRAWHTVAYTSSLWSCLDLSNQYHVVGVPFLRHLLVTSRFDALEWLSLEGCAGVTPAALRLLARHCPHLHTLLLTDCCAYPPRSAQWAVGAVLGGGAGMNGGGLLDPLPPAPVPVRLSLGLFLWSFFIFLFLTTVFCAASVFLIISDLLPHSHTHSLSLMSLAHPLFLFLCMWIGLLLMRGWVAPGLLPHGVVPHAPFTVVYNFSQLVVNDARFYLDPAWQRWDRVTSANVDASLVQRLRTNRRRWLQRQHTRLQQAYVHPVPPVIRPDGDGNSAADTDADADVDAHSDVEDAIEGAAHVALAIDDGGDDRFYDAQSRGGSRRRSESDQLGFQWPWQSDSDDDADACEMADADAELTRDPEERDITLEDIIHLVERFVFWQSGYPVDISINVFLLHVSSFLSALLFCC